MDYKEKFEEAKRLYETANADQKYVLESLFSELKESEDERIRNQIINFIEEYGNPIHCEWQKDWIAWLEKQGGQKPQRMISAEAKEAMYNKPADTVEPKCEESKTKIFDAPTPFEDKLYAFVAACEFLAIPSKIEFILEHSQEILDAAREQIGKEQSSAWSEEDEYMLESIVSDFAAGHKSSIGQDKWLKSLKDRCDWKPSDEQMKALHDLNLTGNISYAGQGQTLIELYNDLKKLKGE